jgi:hypothetical protein
VSLQDQVLAGRPSRGRDVLHGEVATLGTDPRGLVADTELSACGAHAAAEQLSEIQLQE